MTSISAGCCKLIALSHFQVHSDLLSSLTFLGQIKMSPLASSYIIVGAGVFGASTALSLSRENPAPTVILIDRAPFPCPIAASHDINKIVRSDYNDIFYCKLGLQTLQRWREDPLYAQWYHQSGLVKATDERFGRVQKIFDNYKELGVDVKAELFGPKEMKTRFEGLYADADFTDVDDILWNPSSGWAEATKALKATTEAAVENGVHYVSAPVAKLLLQDGKCTGIRTDDGRTFSASKVILSTGAYTAKLLADSAPTQPELQVGDRITACAVCEVAVDLTPEQANRFHTAPVLVLDTGKVLGMVSPEIGKNEGGTDSVRLLQVKQCRPRLIDSSNSSEMCLFETPSITRLLTNHSRFHPPASKEANGRCRKTCPAAFGRRSRRSCTAYTARRFKALGPMSTDSAGMHPRTRKSQPPPF